MAGHTSDHEEYADDVTDLRQAQRIIVALRRQLADLEEQTRPLPNEFTVFLDDEHAAMVRRLYEDGNLIEDQDEDWEFEDAFTEFVTGYIDVQWDTVHLLRQGEEPDPTVLTA